MKKLFLLLISLTSVFVISGCTTTNKNVATEIEGVMEVEETFGVDLSVDDVDMEDLPSSLHYDETTNTSGMMNLSSSTMITDYLRTTVKGEAYMNLVDLINDKEAYEMARTKLATILKNFKKIKNFDVDQAEYTNENLGITYTNADNTKVITVTRNNNVFEVTEDSTEEVKVTTIKIYREGEFNTSNVTLTWNSDKTLYTQSSVRENDNRTVKKFITITKDENGVHNISSERSVEGIRSYRVVAQATNEYAAVNSIYTRELTDTKYYTTEYYNADAELVMSDRGMNKMPTRIQSIKDTMDIFELAVKPTDTFTGTIDSTMTLTVDIEGVNPIANYQYGLLGYFSSDSEITSGDTLYAISSYEIDITVGSPTLGKAIVTFDKVLEVPATVIGPDNTEYYVQSTYMAKFLTIKDGYQLNADYTITSTTDSNNPAEQMFGIMPMFTESGAHEYYNKTNPTEEESTLVYNVFGREIDTTYFTLDTDAAAVINNGDDALASLYDLIPSNY